MNIKEPNSMEGKLITAWRKNCRPDDKEAPIPQHFINGFIDGYREHNPAISGQSA